MIDKHTIERILTDQRAEIEGRAVEQLCSRQEEELVDVTSTQALSGVQEQSGDAGDTGVV